MGGYQRTAISPRVLRPMTAANVELDIRAILPAIRVPTLLLHRTGDMLPIEGARYMAERIPGARLIEMEGDDHWPWMSDPEEVCGHVEEFVTGGRHEPETDRVLATVLFTDIVGSAECASEIGDRRWRELLEAHEQAFRRQLERQDGREVKTTGDGFLATFDGPARAIRCAKAATSAIRALGMNIRAGIHTGECERRNGDIGGIVQSTSGPALRPRPDPVRCSCRALSRTSPWAPTSSSRSVESTSSRASRALGACTPLAEARPCPQSMPCGWIVHW